MNQQYLVTFADQYDDGRSQERPYLLTTVFALLGDGGVEAHGTTADPAELRVLVPIEQLMTLACQPVVGFRKLIVALSQSTHLIAFVTCQWLVYAVSLGAINVHHRCPGFCAGGCLFGYLVAIVRFLQDEVRLTKYKVFHEIRIIRIICGCYYSPNISLRSRSMAGRAHASGMKRQLFSGLPSTFPSRSIFSVR